MPDNKLQLSLDIEGGDVSGAQNAIKKVEEAAQRAKSDVQIGVNVKYNRAGQPYDPSNGRWLRKGAVGTPRSDFVMENLLRGGSSTPAQESPLPANWLSVWGPKISPVQGEGSSRLLASERKLQSQIEKQQQESSNRQIQIEKERQAELARLRKNAEELEKRRAKAESDESVRLAREAAREKARIAKAESDESARQAKLREQRNREFVKSSRNVGVGSTSASDLYELRQAQKLQQIQQSMRGPSASIGDDAKKSAGGVLSLVSASGLLSAALMTSGVVSAAAFVKGMADVGQQVEQAEKRFTAFSGNAIDASRNMDAMNSATGGAMDKMTAMISASQLMSMGLANNSDDLYKIARMATMLGSPMRTAEDKIQDFTMLLANNSIRRLDQFGISIDDVRRRIDEMRSADSNLSKEQAFVNAVMEVGASRVAELEASGAKAATTAQTLGGQIKTLAQEIGKLPPIKIIVETQEQGASSIISTVTNAVQRGSSDAATRLSALKAYIDNRSKEAETWQRASEYAALKGEKYNSIQASNAAKRAMKDVEEARRQYEVLFTRQLSGESNDVGVGVQSRMEAEAKRAEALRGEIQQTSLAAETLFTILSQDASPDVGWFFSNAKIPTGMKDQLLIDMGIEAIDAEAKKLNMSFDLLRRAGGQEWAVEIKTQALMKTFGIAKEEAAKLIAMIDEFATRDGMTVTIKYRMLTEMARAQVEGMRVAAEKRATDTATARSEALRARAAGQQIPIGNNADDWFNRREEEKQAAEEAAREMKSAAAEFRSQVKAAATELRSKVKEALLAGATQVSVADMAATKAGTYQEKPMENARRLNAIAENGHQELIKHPDWAAILGIPPEVIGGTTDTLKAWAAQTSEDVQNFLRPDLINWDAFAQQFAKLEQDAKTQEETILKGVQVLQEKGLLKGMNFGEAKDRVAELLGFTPEGADYSSTIIDNLTKGIEGIKPAVTIGKMLNDDFKDNANVFLRAGDQAGTDLVGGISKAVERDLPGVRYAIASLIAPKVAELLGVKAPSNRPKD